MQTRELSIVELNPKLNATLIKDSTGLSQVEDFFRRVSIFGYDVETNVVNDFTERKVRLIQIGNKEEQYVIDLLHFAGSTEDLCKQGWYTPPGWALPVLWTLRLGLESGKHTKVGVNLGFDYEAIKWSFGLRPFNFYDCMIVEQLIHCGRMPLFQKDFWGLKPMLERYAGLEISKDLQTSFDLCSELTQEQIEYAALDTRFPLAIMAAQAVTIKKSGLERVCRIENQAIPAFGDLHLNGFFLDKEEWLENVEINRVQHIANIATLDKYLIPVVGDRSCPNIDLEPLEKAWRDEQDSVKRAENRKAYQKARKVINDWTKASAKWDGQAAINYGSPAQILAALRKLGYGEKALPNTNDIALKSLAQESQKVPVEQCKNPVIRALQNYRETEKVKDSYGAEYPEKYINKATGRVHSRINQLGADTGRTSATAPNCFSSDTELLTQRGWVMFPDVTKEDLVAQYSLSEGEITFSAPDALIVNDYDGELVSIKTEQQINLLTTPDHRCLLRHRKSGDWKWVEAANYLEDYQQVNSGQYVGGGVCLSDSQVALVAALQADGSVQCNSSLLFSFTKQRKIDRIRDALVASGVAFSERLDENRGIVSFCVKREDVPEWLEDRKFFGPWILSLSKESFNLLSEEVWNWDGCYTRRSHYSSSVKTNADWVQILECLSGKRARLRSYQNQTPNSKLNWQVDVSNKGYSLTTNRTITNIPYTGKVYCVTMPEGTVVVRRGCEVAVTGNCQNIMKGTNWRKCFKPRPGYVMVTVDMSGAELRIMTELSGQQSWVDAFAKNWDVHSVGAEMMYQDRWRAGADEGCPYVSGHQKCDCKAGHKFLRNNSKALNFKICYGGADLSESLNITKKESDEILGLWRKANPTLDKYLQDSGKSASMNMESRTFSGRRRQYIKPTWEKAKELATERLVEDGKDPMRLTSDLVSRAYKSLFSRIERQGKNTPIQGGNIDIAKEAMGSGLDKSGVCYLWQRLEPEFGAYLVSFVHDELVVEAKPENAEEVKAFLVDCIRRAGAEFMTKVTMECDGMISDCWEK